MDGSWTVFVWSLRFFGVCMSPNLWRELRCEGSLLRPSSTRAQQINKAGIHAKTRSSKVRSSATPETWASENSATRPRPMERNEGWSYSLSPTWNPSSSSSSSRSSRAMSRLMAMSRSKCHVHPTERLNRAGEAGHLSVSDDEDAFKVDEEELKIDEEEWMYVYRVAIPSLLEDQGPLSMTMDRDSCNPYRCICEFLRIGLFCGTYDRIGYDMIWYHTISFIHIHSFKQKLALTSNLLRSRPLELFLRTVSDLAKSTGLQGEPWIFPKLVMVRGPTSTTFYWTGRGSLRKESADFHAHWLLC